MKMQDMKQRYRKFKRSWGVWYAFDNLTGNSESLKTREKAEAIQKVNAMNETERQPGISLGLAKVYLNATDPKLATRTWQEVMENPKQQISMNKLNKVDSMNTTHQKTLSTPLITGAPSHLPKAVMCGFTSPRVG
jgi:hypothetical protein